MTLLLSSLPDRHVFTGHIPRCKQGAAIGCTHKLSKFAWYCSTGAPARGRLFSVYPAMRRRIVSDVSTRRLRSTETAMCVVRRSHNIFGDRCFAIGCTTPVELVAVQTTTMRQYWRVQTAAENTLVRGSRRFVTF